MAMMFLFHESSFESQIGYYSRVMIMNIRLALLLLLAFVSSLSAAERPNIIVILCDDLGYGDLSSYGATDLQTPNIDHLADSGMKWRRFYANCTVCSPTRAAFLTGKFPDQAGVPGVIRTHDTDSWGFWIQTLLL